MSAPGPGSEVMTEPVLAVELKAPRSRPTVSPLPERAAWAAGRVLPSIAGTSTRCGPLERTTVTPLPRLTRVRASGLWRTTCPLGTFSLYLPSFSTPRSRSPWSASRAEASPRDSPSTGGTVVTPLRTKRLNEV